MSYRLLIGSYMENLKMMRMQGSKTEKREDVTPVPNLNESNYSVLSNSSQSKLPELYLNGISRNESMMSDYFQQKLFGRKDRMSKLLITINTIIDKNR